MDNAVKKQIITVDDSPIILKMLMNILGKEYEVIPFSKGMRALDYLHAKIRYRPDLVILDVEMPDINGYQLLRQIKTIYQEINMPPVIFLTSNHEKEDVMKAIFYGAKDYAVKPIDEKSLLEKVHKVLGEA